MKGKKKREKKNQVRWRSHAKKTSRFAKLRGRGVWFLRPSWTGRGRRPRSVPVFSPGRGLFLGQEKGAWLNATTCARRGANPCPAVNQGKTCPSNKNVAPFCPRHFGVLHRSQVKKSRALWMRGERVFLEWRGPPCPGGGRTCAQGPSVNRH